MMLAMLDTRLKEQTTIIENPTTSRVDSSKIRSAKQIRWQIIKIIKTSLYCCQKLTSYQYGLCQPTQMTMNKLEKLEQKIWKYLYFCKNINTAIRIKTLISLMNGSTKVALSSFKDKFLKIVLNFYLNCSSLILTLFFNINHSRKIGQPTNIIAPTEAKTPLKI